MCGRLTSLQSSRFFTATALVIALGCSGKPPTGTCNASGVGSATGSDPCAITGGAGTGGVISIGGDTSTGGSVTDTSDAATAGSADAEAGTVTPSGIVTITSEGESLETLAVLGQVLVFFRPEATAMDISQLIEGLGATRLAQGIYGDRYLVQVPVGAEGQYIATIKSATTVLDATPNIVSQDFTAGVLESKCGSGSAHARDVIAAFTAGSNGGIATCYPVTAQYLDVGLGLSATIYYDESAADNVLENTLGAGSGSRYLNSSFGPRVDIIESLLAEVNPTLCKQTDASTHPCLSRAQNIAMNGLRLAWTARLRVISKYCSSFDALTCNAILSLAAGNDALDLSGVLSSIRSAGVTDVLLSNAVVVGVDLTLGNSAPYSDTDFVIGANAYAVTGGPNTKGVGTSLAAPFVLGLVSRKADELRSLQDSKLTSVADVEALCMVKIAATKLGKLGDADFVNITERCCLDRPGTSWNPNSQPPACECPSGQTWNANAQPPACQCPTGQTECGGLCVDSTCLGGTFNSTSCQCPDCLVSDSSASVDEFDCSIVSRTTTTSGKTGQCTVEVSASGTVVRMPPGSGYEVNDGVGAASARVYITGNSSGPWSFTATNTFDCRSDIALQAGAFLGVETPGCLSYSFGTYLLGVCE
jgi:hypothetical protein